MQSVAKSAPESQTTGQENYEQQTDSSWSEFLGSEDHNNDVVQNGNSPEPNSRKWARGYRDAGLNPLPIRADGSKAPAISSWGHLKDCAVTEAELMQFNGDTGVGIICGKVSGNLEVLDFDRPGSYEDFAALCQDHGLGEQLNSCVLVATPSGGHHLYYRCDEPVDGNKKLARWLEPCASDATNARLNSGVWGKVKTLIETRGEGGYIVAPGSPTTCHPARKPYKLVRGVFTAIPVLPAATRQAFHDIARACNEFVEPDRVNTGGALASHAGKSGGGNRPGDDFNRRGDMGPILEKHGWTRTTTRGGKSFWRRPGKAGGGISATENYADSGLFHVFSSNAAPFDSDRSYSPFAVYALLERGGDFKAAARALTELGYGEKSSVTEGSAGFAGCADENFGDNNGAAEGSAGFAGDFAVDFSNVPPLPFTTNLLPVPKLQPAMIPAPLRAWMVDIAYRMSCPLEYGVIAALIVIASLVGRQIGIRPKRFDEWKVIPNLWGAIIGPPGCLKTPAVQEAMKPLKRLEDEAIEAAKIAEQEHEALLVMAKVRAKEAQKKLEAAARKGKASDPDALELARQIVDNPTPPVMKRYLVSDPTIEALGERLKENPIGLLAFRDELAGFFRNLEKKGHESDRAFYLEAWNGTVVNYISDRIGRGVNIIPALCLSILGTIQPGPLFSYIRQALGGNGADGFIQRFQLLVYPDPCEWQLVDQLPDKEDKDRAYEVYRALSCLDMEAIGATQDEDDGIPYLSFCPEAQELFFEWLTELETQKLRATESELLECHLAKYRSLMPSLALLFHLIMVVNGAPAGPVSLLATQMAAAWCDLLEAHARRIYTAAIGGSHDVAQLLADHLRDLTNPFAVRDVTQKGWSGLGTPEQVVRAVSKLESMRWVKGVNVPPGPQSGRPSRKVFINPLALMRQDGESA